MESQNGLVKSQVGNPAPLCVMGVFMCPRIASDLCCINSIGDYLITKEFAPIRYRRKLYRTLPIHRCMIVIYSRSDKFLDGAFYVFFQNVLDDIKRFCYVCIFGRLCRLYV